MTPIHSFGKWTTTKAFMFTRLTYQPSVYRHHLLRYPTPSLLMDPCFILPELMALHTSWQTEVSMPLSIVSRVARRFATCFIGITSGCNLRSFFRLEWRRLASYCLPVLLNSLIQRIQYMRVCVCVRSGGSVCSCVYAFVWPRVSEAVRLYVILLIVDGAIERFLRNNERICSGGQRCWRFSGELILASWTMVARRRILSRSRFALTLSPWASKSVYCIQCSCR